MNFFKKLFKKEQQASPEALYLQKRFEVMKFLELVSDPTDQFNPGLIWMDIEIFSPDMVISKIDTKCEFNECGWLSKKTIYLDYISRTIPFLDYKKNVCGRLRLVNKNYLDNKFQPKKDASFHKPDRVQVTREFIVNGYLEELSIRVCDRYLGDCELEFKIKNK